MEKVIGYLDESIEKEYLELLSSRWAALLPRIAKRTQRLQSLTNIAESAALAKEVEGDFQLVGRLLDAEHDVYQDGVVLFAKAFPEADHPVRRTWELLAKDMISELTAKEMMLAHWRAAPDTIPLDTLKVYSHALLVHSRVDKTRVQHLRHLVTATQS